METKRNGEIKGPAVEDASAPQRPRLARRRAAGVSVAEILTRRGLLKGRVFECFGCAEADHCLGLNLDCFSRRRIAPHARLTVRLHRAADSRNHKFARATTFLDSEVKQLVEKRSRLLL